MDNSKRLELLRCRTHTHARINMDREDSRASSSITDAHLTSLECVMPIPLQRPSGWQLPWWRMMFYRANERGPRRFITPVWATTFSRTYGRTDGRTDAHARKTKEQTNLRHIERRLPYRVFWLPPFVSSSSLLAWDCSEFVYFSKREM